MHGAGVDGCRAGWVGLRLYYEGNRLKEWEWRVFPNFQEVLRLWGTLEAIAVDMPIGLLSTERAVARPCDLLARQRLGRRRSSIFIPPTRPMLSAREYAPLRALGLSVQAYHLIPRIRELDSLLIPDLQKQVWETHPELSFSALTGSPMAHSKRTPEGQNTRLSALLEAFGEVGGAIWQGALELREQYPRSVLAMDDLLDAWVLAWSGERHLRGCSETLVGEPSHDERGLLMAIRF